MAESRARIKRTSFTINLLQTTNGYSLVEGTELLNKPAAAIATAPVLNTQIQPNPSNSTVHLPSINHVPARQYKPVFKKLNLIMLRGKESNAKEGEIISTPLECKKYTHWFETHQVHQIQRRFLIEWFTELYHSIQNENQTQFLLFQKEYMHMRNSMIKLYLSTEPNYLSLARVRQQIAADAYLLMKIHLLLSDLLIINYKDVNFAQESNDRPNVWKIGKNGRQLVGIGSNIAKTTNQMTQSQLLKKITAQIRPHCDYCGVHCSVVWFQHSRILDIKDVTTIMKNVNQKNPPLSQRQYEYILCARCFCDGNFPLLLTHRDFKKITANDKLEPNRKRKNKKRRKEKKAKAKSQQAEEEQEEGQREEEDEANGMNGKEINGIKQKEREVNSRGEEDQCNGEQAEGVQTMIDKLLSNQPKQKEWTLHQTERLLQLVEKYGEDWTQIHSKLQKEGLCEGIDTDEIIHYFLSLPMRDISKLQQEYEDQEFIEANYNCNQTHILDTLSEKKLQFSNKLWNKLGQDTVVPPFEQDWKTKINSLVRLMIKKYNGRIDSVERMEQILKERRDL